MTPISENKCQYWSTEEPLQCIYWNESDTVCDYVSKKSELDPTQTFVFPEHGPYCNLIGTSISCAQYESSNPGSVLPRCILPDPRRHVCNRGTGEKWVTLIGDAEWSFDDINGYNEGNCNAYGTDTTCSGYSPYHLGFGVLQPSDEAEKYDTFKEGRFSTTEEFGYILPTNFVVYNIRAALSRCYWWKHDQSMFTVNSDSGKVELSGGWHCECVSDTSAYSEFTSEDGPPCNGCKPECSNYTGVYWKYCIDEKMRIGDPILAEQIHELRYYHREHNWTVTAIQSIFIDEGDIFTWAGTRDTGICESDSDGNLVDEGCVPSNAATLKGTIATTIGDGGYIEEYSVPAIKVNMPSFDEFTLANEHVVLTQGTLITKELKDYPTLIRQLQLLPLSPIIQTEFTQYIGNGKQQVTLFETPYLKEDVEVLIYGKLFYSTPAYALNLSDKDLKSVLPQELYYFDSIYDIEEELSAEAYDIFKDKLANILRIIYKISPEKVFYNTLPDEDRTFLIPTSVLNCANTFDSSNKNSIMVFQECHNYFTYDKITFEKRVVGGMLFQNNFSIEGDGADVTPPIYDFEKSFMASFNDNGEMSFSFSPFFSAGISTEAMYIYNDSYHTDTLSGDSWAGYKKYKITIPTYILRGKAVDEYKREVKQIGSNGYMLISLENLEVNSVVQPWEVETITVTYTKDSTLPNGNTQTKTTNCEMEIVAHGADGKLAQNQIIVKPKNMTDFKPLCIPTVTLSNIVYWEKRSFGQEPSPTMGSFEEDTDDNDPIPNTMDGGEFVGTPEDFTVENFKFTMVPSVVMADSTGAPFVQSRTKPIGVVKQVGCPDVEIYYRWEATYTQYQNLPECAYCCGQAHEDHIESGILRSKTPLCGDHFECRGCFPGPTWWPYNRCHDYESYSQVTNLDNWDLEMIGLFQMKEGDGWVHGKHDMRMLGPHKRYADTGLYCPPKMCYCTMQTYNSYIEGEPYFAGWGKVRAAVDYFQLATWYATGSDPVMQFGNERRSVLRSYRTMDSAPYIRADVDPSAGVPKVRIDWKLMPAAQMFSRADITLNEDEMWNYFCSDDGPNVVNPLGFFLAGGFDSVDINEKFDSDNRFRFEQIIRCCHGEDLGYPKTVGEYSQSTGSSVISPWYEFKRYPVGGSSDYIQWAWQEPWKKIKRNYDSEGSVNYSMYTRELLEESYTKAPFIDKAGIQGLCVFVDVSQPMYKYDWQNEEFRLTADENLNAILHISPPAEKDKHTGEYLGYFKVQLNDGPARGINWGGEWLTEENADGTLAGGESYTETYNTVLYDTCIAKVEDPEEGDDVVTKWSDKVTLFDTGYTNTSTQAADDDKRMVEKYAEFGILTKTYFQRGLSVTPIAARLGEAPLLITSISAEATSEPEPCTCGMSQQFGFKFDSLKTIGRFAFTYRFGSEDVSKDENQKIYHYYHMPQFCIYSSDDGETFNESDLLYKTDMMELYNGTSGLGVEIITKTVEWVNTWEYICNGKEGVVVVLRTSPTENEILESENEGGVSGRYTTSINLISVTHSKPFEEVLTEASEKLAYWERKYYVSYGQSGDHPPQGDGNSEVLTTFPLIKSTCWQLDTEDGVAGVDNSAGQMSFMNKVRGRFVFDVYEDEHVLTGSVSDMENLQKKLYDQAASKATSTSTMDGIINPGLQQLLHDNGVVFVGAGKSLALRNTLITPLAEINQFPTMSAEGHSYISEPPGDDTGCPLSCIFGSSFTFAYTNFDGDYATDLFDSSHEAPNSFWQYNWGTYWMMQRRYEDIELRTNVFPEIYARDTASSIYVKSADELKSSMFYPSLDPKDVSGGGGVVNVLSRRNPVLPFYWGGMWGITLEPLHIDFDIF